ncbi:cytochrome b N-terminal domain-containing protein [Bartonella alsatica]|uniref:cytochrome b N-terminal domain-containing protein n=1 Tax=Bartonella alsatica TaxID=52764 RepID=UPI002475DC6F|nr:cytochrome b N-terminal domain-containing protein [Bartonella alsatica]
MRFSLFFIAVYIHLARVFYYGFYKNMYEIVWVTDICVCITMMVIAFLVMSWFEGDDVCFCSFSGF